jgi:hypothetical protein
MKLIEDSKACASSVVKEVLLGNFSIIRTHSCKLEPLKHETPRPDSPLTFLQQLLFSSLERVRIPEVTLPDNITDKRAAWN